MQAAAAKLTPVTLEPGGKSPALVHPSYPVEPAADRIPAAKPRSRPISDPLGVAHSRRP